MSDSPKRLTPEEVLAELHRQEMIRKGKELSDALFSPAFLRFQQEAAHGLKVNEQEIQKIGQVSSFITVVGMEAARANGLSDLTLIMALSNSIGELITEYDKSNPGFIEKMNRYNLTKYIPITGERN